MRIHSATVTRMAESLKFAGGGYDSAQVIDSAVSEMMSQMQISRAPREWAHFARTLRTTFSLLEDVAAKEMHRKGGK